ncbi:MAG: DUF177 domain-containing protein [Lachnospiraceae bacterium]|nr:DUF177 domain-containing protein [Lachnospiraceae bacterium]MBQ9593611.1 DUF177 domain-containing protein [Lachnospiraceae bacterium]
MIISLAEIMQIPNESRQMEIPVEAERIHVAGMDHKVISKEPLKLTVTNLGNRRVALQGATKIVLAIPCSRCLDEVDVPFEIEIDDEIDFRQKEAGPDEIPDERVYIDGTNLDVERLIYDEILLDFPLQTLCREDCKGICKVCGVNLNRETCSCDQTVLDPRMAAFQDIFDQFKEV